MALDLSSLVQTLPSSSGGASHTHQSVDPQLDIKLLCWNIHGPGKAQDRNKLVPLLVRGERPDIVLLQETKTDSLVASIRSQARGVGRDYLEVSAGDTTEARVLYDSTIFEAISRDARIFPGRHRRTGEGGRGGGETRISLSEALEQSIPEEQEGEQRELRGRRAGGMRELFRRRIAIVGLKRKDQILVANNVVIVMSFHNVNTSQGGAVREKGARGFCQIVHTMSQLTGTLVVAGADLNQPMKSPRDPIIPIYQPTVRRSTKVIDYFFLDSPRPERLGRHEVTALDIAGAVGDPLNRLHQLMNDLLRGGGSIGDYTKALDHDPLVCEVTILP